MNFLALIVPSVYSFPLPLWPACFQFPFHPAHWMRACSNVCIFTWPAEQNLFFAYFPVILGLCPLRRGTVGAQRLKSPFWGQNFFVLPPARRRVTALHLTLGTLNSELEYSFMVKLQTYAVTLVCFQPHSAV